MTLSDNLHLGDRVQLAPSWEHGEHNSQPAVQLATVIYIHPEGRYCTVRYQCGLTDTIQTVPSERVAHPKDIPEHDGFHKGPVRNKYLRDRLRGLPVSQREISAAFGYGHSWLSNRMDNHDLTAKEQQEILSVAESIAANRKSP